MEIQNPHDKFFKAIISQVKYAKELISIKLPEGMKSQLDWEGQKDAKPALLRGALIG